MLKIEITNLPQGLSDSEIEAVVGDACHKLGLDISNSILEIDFVPSKKMAELNLSYRNVTGSTDVLSFPQTNLKFDQNIFGTIVISPDDAKERGEEIKELVRHGLLHLAGYDHDSDSARWLGAAKIINHNMGL